MIQITFSIGIYIFGLRVICKFLHLLRPPPYTKGAEGEILLGGGGGELLASPLKEMNG